MAETHLTRTEAAAADFLEGSLSAHEPLAALVGPPGTGKTITLNVVLDTREGSGARIIRINNFVAGPLSLHRVLAASLGVADAGELSPEHLEPILRKALADDRQAEPPIVAVDDAQSLLPETLRYLCLMAGLREAGRPLFRILLVGRPGFTMREAIPSQFVLEPMRAEDSRRFLTSQLGQTGVTLPDDVLEPMVQQGQGNLRKLAALLSVRIASGERLPKRPSKPEPAKMAAAPVNSSAAPASRGQGSGASGSGNAGSGRALRGKAAIDGSVPGSSNLARLGLARLRLARFGLARFGRESLGLASPGLMVATPAAIVGCVVVGVLLLRVAPSHRHVPSSQPNPVMAAHTIAPPPAVPPAVPSSRPDAAAPGSQENSDNPEKAAPADPAPVATIAPTGGSAAGPAALTSAVPAPQPPPAPAIPAAPQESVAVPPPAAIAPASTPYRVYNISPCHHTMCPRWSVTDMSRTSRFVAGFDLNTLHLNPALAQHIREGTIDIIVDGHVSDQKDGGRLLQADSLEATVAHHGRYVPSPDHPGQQQSSPDQSAPAQAPASQPPSQSPPPGFLSYPAHQPVQEAPLSAPQR